MEKLLKENRPGACKKIPLNNPLRNEQGEIFSLRDMNSVMFVVCQTCQSLFESNRTQANNLIFTASLLAELKEEKFPEELLSDDVPYDSYYLELEKCEDCLGADNKIKCRVKKIPE